MSARIEIKRYEATPAAPASMAIWIADGAASIHGTVFIGRPLNEGLFVIHMSNPAFGNVLGSMRADVAMRLLAGVLGPIDFSRNRLAVAA